MMKTKVIANVFVGLFVTALTLFFVWQNNDHGTYDLETFKIDGGWGYSIRKNHQLLIYQDCIPAINGKTAFPTAKTAHNTGKTVITKLRRKQSPVLSTGEIYKLIKNVKID